MIIEDYRFFSENEEELVTLLINIGIDIPVAKVLVYLTRAPEGTSRVLECGTHLRPKQVSTVLQYLHRTGWIFSREHKTDNGHRVRIYKLAKPIPEIIKIIMKDE